MASESEAPPSPSREMLPCQYYVLGVCSHENQSGCKFSHDPNVAKPGILKEPCKHYAGGYCRNGGFCLNVHDPESRIKKPANRELKPVITMYNQMAINSQPPRAPEREIDLKGTCLEGDGLKLETLSFNNNKVSSPEPSYDSYQPYQQQQYKQQDQGLNQDFYHRGLEQEETVYFYGDLPTQQPPAMAPATKAVDWGKIASTMEGQDASSGPVCKFFLAGNCRFGDTCRNTHTVQTQEQQEHTEVISRCEQDVEMTEFERECSVDLECGICLENIMQTSTKRFGILTGCDHVFCLKCIKDWRSSDTKSSENGQVLVRRCPLCREPSYFVIPCDRMVRDPERKKMLIEGYQQGMGTIHCKHFDRGNGTCPFGTSCFYKHVYSNGTVQDPGEVRIYRDGYGGTRTESVNRLGAYFDKALKR
uniref:RING-type E3 ubiquitin transferase n=1 Tax=Mucochytrium quahogii TaxID=96639 RepID=A0A7S2WI76_9STRA